MAKKILERDVDTRQLFSIEWDGERYYAVRESNPRFVMSGDTIVEAASAAERAMEICKKIR